MKKTFLLFLLIVFVSFVLSAGEEEVVIKDMEPFSYAAMDFTGSFEKMEQSIGLFMKEFFKQGLQPAGPVLGVYYNDPSQVKEEDLKWAVGFSVAKDTKVQAPLKKVETTFKKAAVYLYTGPYEKMDKAYEKIFKYIEDKGCKMVWPCYDKYLNNPQTVKPEELKTEIIVPVEKK
ncbi:MAG: GyrI-like domain-containing protein [Candidatus Aminicenantes bacterium]|nr:GyrI-like domain-containing protein [Candidatus Aminicenantes bacterium]